MTNHSVRAAENGQATPGLPRPVFLKVKNEIFEKKVINKGTRVILDLLRLLY